MFFSMRFSMEFLGHDEKKSENVFDGPHPFFEGLCIALYEAEEYGDTRLLDELKAAYLEAVAAQTEAAKEEIERIRAEITEEETV